MRLAGHYFDIFQIMIVSLVIAFSLPIILQLLSKWLNDKFRITMVCLFLIVILYFTIFSKNLHIVRTANLIPFWSYREIGNDYIRYQIYMNIFLFIPLGFLIPFSSKKTFLQTLILGCCLSIIIEALQFIFALGLCETDDVIHNTLGCIIGYWYWFGLSELGEKFQRDRE